MSNYGLVELTSPFKMALFIIVLILWFITKLHFPSNISISLEVVLHCLLTLASINFVQELNFAEIARRLHDVPAGLHHNYTAPLEYFQWLVVTFESRIKEYKQQLDELEMYLSAPAQTQSFSPQGIQLILSIDAKTICHCLEGMFGCINIEDS